MNINEARIVDGIVNYEANVNKILEYIKVNYDINGEYQPETCTIKLSTVSPENALMLAAAKEYIENMIGDDLVRVVF